MSTKNVKQTKRPHSGKLGKKQVEFIYNLRGRHTMRIKAEFKKQYGYDIAASRIKSAIQSYEANNKASVAVNKSAQREKTNTKLMIMEEGVLYTLEEYVNNIRTLVKEDTINKIINGLR